MATLGPGFVLQPTESQRRGMLHGSTPAGPRLNERKHPAFGNGLNCTFLDGQPSPRAPNPIHEQPPRHLHPRPLPYGFACGMVQGRQGGIGGRRSPRDHAHAAGSALEMAHAWCRRNLDAIVEAPAPAGCRGDHRHVRCRATARHHAQLVERCESGHHVSREPVDFSMVP